jgi:hypothetical protein
VLLIGDAIVRLAGSAQDRADTRRALLGYLHDQQDPEGALRLCDPFARLGPTAADLPRIRAILVTLLAKEHDYQTREALEHRLALLHPTVTDLLRSGDSNFPPTTALLTAVRRNATITSWLNALRLLSSPTAH